MKRFKTKWILVINLMMVSCINSNNFEFENYKDIPTDIQNEIQNSFYDQQLSGNIPTDFSVLWRDNTQQYSDEIGITYFEFPLIHKSGAYSIDKGNYQVYYTLLASLSENLNYDFYLVKFFDEDQVKSLSDTDLSFANNKVCSGIIHVLDKKNEFYFAKKMKNGEVLRQNLFTDNEIKESNKSSKIIEECAIVTTYHYLDWYVNGVYQDSWLTGITEEYSCIYYYYPELYTNGGGGGGDYFSENGGGSYSDCGDPIHGCVFEVFDGPDIPWENEQSIGRLCSNISFAHIGNGFTAEFHGLGVTAYNTSTEQIINSELSSVCITIPEYYVSNSTDASQKFISVANSARDIIPHLLNSGELYPSSTSIRNKLRLSIQIRLTELYPGSSFSSGSCSGSIPITTADYSCP